MDVEFDEHQVMLNDYNLMVSCGQNQTGESVLCVQLSDVYTGDSWKGTFESSYIEELTRKTGNFKSFQIFINMLKTAMNKKSNTVTLEILTYNDLEQLRLKKMSSNTAGHASNQNQNNTKRYLILTYNVEFDRINYPLQLNHQGKTDVNILVNTINNLRNLVKTYENRFEAMNKLESRPRKLISECDNEDRDELSNVKPLRKEKDSDSNQTKLLKQIIKTIEEKSLKEKNLLQKQLLKRKQEIDILKQQLSESKLSERNLKNEIRMLNNEVRMLKRPCGAQKRSSSCESLSRLSDSSSVRRLALQQPVHQNRLNQSRSSVNSRNSSRNSSLSRNGSVRNIPSPVNSLSSVNSQRSNTGRFNPTEYVKNRKLKLEENELKRRKGASVQKRTSSKERSQLSAFDSDSDVYSYMSFEHENHASRLSNGSRSSNKKACEKKSSNKDADFVDFFSTHQEMKEIDAKLKSLQLLIKNNSNI